MFICVQPIHSVFVESIKVGFRMVAILAREQKTRRPKKNSITQTKSITLVWIPGIRTPLSSSQIKDLERIARLAFYFFCSFPTLPSKSAIMSLLLWIRRCSAAKQRRSYALVKREILAMSESRWCYSRNYRIIFVGKCSAGAERETIDRDKWCSVLLLWARRALGLCVGRVIEQT